MSRRGFKDMEPSKQRAIASMGGKAVRAKDRGWSRDKKAASAAGRKGGLERGRRARAKKDAEAASKTGS